MTDAPDIPLAREAARLVGHEAAVDILGGQLASGRPHHAWLISGPKGVGKATLAYQAAKALLSDGPVSPDVLRSPPQTPAAAQVAGGAAPSLFVFERRISPKTGKLLTEIDVDQVRAHTQRMHLRTAGGAWRVAIVDSVDELNASSANALLKILEEPPARTLFFLVNHARGRTLATIRSRCAALALEPLSEAEMAEVLTGMELALAPDDTALLARLSGGSPGRALALAAADGPALYREMVALLSALPEPKVAQVHKLGDKLARDRTAELFRTFGDLLTAWLAEAVRHGAGDAPAAEGVPGEAAALARWRDTVNLERGAALWEKVANQFRRADARSLDRKQALLDVMFSLQEAARGA